MRVAQKILQNCCDEWQEHGFVERELLEKLNNQQPYNKNRMDELRSLALLFNGSDISLAAIDKKANEGDDKARALMTSMQGWIDGGVPYKTINAKTYHKLRTILDANPDAVFNSPKLELYPYYTPGRNYGYDINWVRKSLERSTQLFEKFKAERTSDVAVLVGNGPSLNKTNLSLLKGHDVYVSNYAIKHPELSGMAKGVAVTNYLVAEQEPYQFYMDESKWKIFPFWLRNTFIPDDKTIFLNAEGGDLFCSDNVLQRVAWHSTVTFFWLQILYTAGYRKVLMIGFDHSYTQKANAQQGDVLLQSEDDPNHFDKNYFKGKKWQAADVDKMEETYLLAKGMYERDGREIVNCTVDGALEAFRRSSLERELPPLRRPKVTTVQKNTKPKIAIVTAFWKGDAEEAERQWRLINRLGLPSQDHIHLFKHGPDMLPPVTMPNVKFANVEQCYPEYSKMPHPAGPNLVFAHTVKMMKDSDYTHFFWLETDCVPTSANWLDSFAEGAKKFPDEPIVGTGGGTTVPGRLHWRHHFAGPSLYNIEKIAALDWDKFLADNIDISFDIWMSITLGYIALGEQNDEDQESTIIYGSHRYNWKLLRRPPSVVLGMFEHWRPNKFLSKEQLGQRLKLKDFKLFHAIKDQDMIREIFADSRQSATTIIINYNNGKFLKDAINSTLDQSGLDAIEYEVIVVDDGSTDNSIEIIRSFGDKIRPLFLTHGKQNGNFNQQRALRRALELVQGNIVLLLDGDDIFETSKVTEVVNAFDDPDVVLVQHAVKRIDENGADLNSPVEFFTNARTDFDLYTTHKRTNFFQPTSGLAYRRNYLSHAMRWLDEDRFEITWLDVRLSRLAPAFGKIVNLTAQLGSWRRHSASDSMRTDNIKERMIQHHDWFNQAAAEFNFSVAYKGSKQDTSMQEFISTNYPRSCSAHVEETELVMHLLSDRKGSSHTIFDVGAHIGGSSAPFATNGWQVYCFEPDATNRAKLASWLGKRPNVKIDSRAVSDVSESGKAFYTSEESTGISGMLVFRDSHKEVAKVDVTTVAEIVKDNRIDHIDFLKIDVEGYDFSVIKGVPWNKLKPDVIECEFEDAKTKNLGHSWRDISEFLVDKGYAVYVSEWHPIIRYGTRHDWLGLKKYPCQLEDEKAWGNLLAFKTDPGPIALQQALNKALKVKHPIYDPTSKKEGQESKKLSQSKTMQKTIIPSPTPTYAEPGLTFYARLALWLQAKAPTLFGIGQFGMWALRAIKRHPVMALLVTAIFTGLIAAPLFAAPLAPFANWLWGASGGLALLTTLFLVTRFGNNRIRKFAENQHYARQNLRTEFLRELKKLTNEGAAQQKHHAQQIGHLEKQIAEQVQKTDQLTQNLDQKTGQIVKSTDQLEKQIAEQIQKTDQLTQNLDQKTGHIVKSMDQLTRSASVFNFGEYHNFNRKLSREHTDIITKEWTSKLDLTTTPKALSYLAHRICMLESNMHGRLATTIEDAVLRTLVASSIKSDKLRVLEIGTLFGIGLIMVYEYAKQRFDNVHITALDPLEGYYSKNVRDIITDEAINEGNLRHNLEVAGVDEADFSLIKALSTSKKAIKSARQKGEYDVLIIDGDHSYNGVKADFTLYLPFVSTGGYIIFDDYSAPDWPGVQKFVDESVHDHPDVAFIGASWRTAVFQVVRKVETQNGAAKPLAQQSINEAK